MTLPRYNCFVITEERESFLTDELCIRIAMQSTHLARAIVEGSKDRTIFSTRVSGVEKTLARESSPLAKLAHAEAPRQLHANGSTPLRMLLRYSVHKKHRASG